MLFNIHITATKPFNNNFFQDSEESEEDEGEEKSYWNDTSVWKPISRAKTVEWADNAKIQSLCVNGNVGALVSDIYMLDNSYLTVR